MHSPFTIQRNDHERTENAGAGMGAAVGSGSSAGYQVAGVIRNIGGVTSFVGTPVKRVLGENVTGWDVEAATEDALDALVVKVQGFSGATIR